MLAALEKLTALLREMGRPSEALASAAKALAVADDLLRETPDDLSRLIARGRALATVACLEREVPGAMRPETRALLNEAIQRLEQHPQLITAQNLYDLSCMLSTLSAPVQQGSGASVTSPPLDRAALADRAIVLLRQAVAAGWNDIARMRRDTLLDPLRERPDFQALLLDVAFPRDPFAR